MKPLAGVGRSTVIVASLGFEERFLLRSVIRRGVKENDKIVVIMPEKGNQRGEKAFQTLKELMDKAFPSLEIVKHEVNIQDFYGTVSNIRNLLSELNLKGNIVLNISGGQRLLILEILAAALSLGINAELEIETEDSSTYLTIPIKTMHPLKLDSVDREILREAAKRGEIRLKDLEKLEIPKPTIWRKLNRLVEEGLLEKNKNKYKLSDLGRTRI